MALFRRKATPKPKAAPAPTGLQPVKDYEHKEQAKFFAVLSQVDHPAARLTFAVPNQAVAKMRSKAMRIRFWKEGVRAGVPDVLCLYPHGGYHGLAIEAKSPQGRLSPEQGEWFDRLKAAGWCVVEARSAQEMFTAWLDYLDLEARYF